MNVRLFWAITLMFVPILHADDSDSDDDDGRYRVSKLLSECRESFNMQEKRVRQNLAAAKLFGVDLKKVLQELDNQQQKNRELMLISKKQQ